MPPDSTVPDQEWFAIPGHADYEINKWTTAVRRATRGNRTDDLTGRIIKPRYSKNQRTGANKYLRVQLTNKKSYFVHILMLRTFVGEKPSPKHEAAHKDGNMVNNSLDNLRWATRDENEADKARHKTTYLSRDGSLKKNPLRKLTIEQVIEIRSVKNIYTTDAIFSR